MKSRLWVRHRLLPADEIGHIEILDVHTARSASWGRYNGVKLGLGQRSTVPQTDSPAVFIHQQRHGEKLKAPGWAVCTDHPEQLVAALHHIRGAAAADRGAPVIIQPLPEPTWRTLFWQIVGPSILGVLLLLILLSQLF